MAEEIEYAPLEGPAAPTGPREPDLHHLHDVPVELAVEIGRTRMTIGETLKLGPGAIVSLNRLAGEPVDLLETLAQRLADVCLAYGPVQAVEVTVHKPEADLGVAFDDVTVAIRRERP